MAAVLFVAKVVGLGLVGYATLMFIAQRRAVFPGVDRAPARSAEVAPAGVRQVWLEPSFGRVEAWYLEAGAGGPRPRVVFAHGNGELIDDWYEPMERLRAEGVDVLLVEFPGYGHSDGTPSRRSIRETFRVAHDWLVDEAGADPARIVAYGRSLGGGAASDLAMDRPVGALALQSTFTSAAAMAREMLLPGFLVRDRFDNRRAVDAFDGPVLVMHGRRDEVISFTHALGLASVRDDLEVTELDCAHNDCASEWPRIVDTLTDFLDRNGLRTSTGVEAD